MLTDTQPPDDQAMTEDSSRKPLREMDAAASLVRDVDLLKAWHLTGHEFELPELCLQTIARLRSVLIDRIRENRHLQLTLCEATRLDWDRAARLAAQFLGREEPVDTSWTWLISPIDLLYLPTRPPKPRVTPPGWTSLDDLLAALPSEMRAEIEQAHQAALAVPQDTTPNPGQRYCTSFCLKDEREFEVCLTQPFDARLTLITDLFHLTGQMRVDLIHQLADDAQLAGEIDAAQHDNMQRWAEERVALPRIAVWDTPSGQAGKRPDWLECLGDEEAKKYEFCEKQPQS